MHLYSASIQSNTKQIFYSQTWREVNNLILACLSPHAIILMLTWMKYVFRYYSISAYTFICRLLFISLRLLMETTSYRELRQPSLIFIRVQLFLFMIKLSKLTLVKLAIHNFNLPYTRCGNSISGITMWKQNLSRSSRASQVDFSKADCCQYLSSKDNLLKINL